MADLIFNSFREYMADGTFDLDGDTLKCALLTSSYTPDATDAVLADLSGEVSSTETGYTTGGATLTDVTWTRSGATVTLDAANPAWTSASFTARYAAIYKSGTANSITNPLICLLDFGSDKTCSNGTFTVAFNASGILTLS
ncbi:MAG: hypothetical protein RDU30_09865 [Desulfovibrionaceae bacterium]|nr:hypothetical protein [Desulfovibrionaceae bacterium]